MNESNLFSPVTLRQMLYASPSSFSAWLSAAESAFDRMLKSYRNAYAYQDLLFDKLVLGKHSLSTQPPHSQSNGWRGAGQTSS